MGPPSGHWTGVATKVIGITVSAILESHGLCVLAKKQQIITKESSIVELTTAIPTYGLEHKCARIPPKVLQ
jgi:hypothetical protein